VFAGNREMSASSLLVAALELGGRGYPVFPVYEPGVAGGCACHRGRACSRPGKHPRTEHGLKDASCDPRRIQAWWHCWQAASIGVAVPTGHAVLDLDDLRATEGLKAEGYALPGTAAVRTARGLHLWYLIEGSDLKPTSGIFPHVDLRAPGSFVVAPPSQHSSGAVYTWTQPLERISPAPDWLYTLAGHRGGKPGAWRDALEHPVAEGQGRNVALASYAGRAFRFLPARQALEFCRWLNETRFVPPLGTQEFERVVSSIAAREVARRRGSV